MEQKFYTGLFEDEVSEVLRSLPHESTVIMDAQHEFYPAGMVCEDGIYTSGEDSYTKYFNGKRTGNHVGRKYLIDNLAHKTFSVITR